MTRDPTTRRRRALRRVLATALCATLGLFAGRGEGADGDAPYVGYVFPAGARVGTTVRVAAGGQNLRGVSEAFVSGSGVRARVIDLLPPWRPLDGPTARVILRALEDARDAKLAAAKGRPPPAPREAPMEIGPDGKPEKPPPLPDHPLLADLGSRSVEELKRIGEYFLKPRNLQQVKRAIAETARVELVVEPGAKPGPRELRLRTPEGLTNPIRFDVGTLPELAEAGVLGGGERSESAADLPVVWNGQILPNEVDRFRFRAKEGQALVVRTDARHLIPYQADSVPGWMQAVVAIYDEEGKEVAYADDFRFDPDPVFPFVAPRTGEYVLEVRDALYRGREDFVYRVTVSEQPFVTGTFPLGGRLGETLHAKAFGWNLPFARVELDTTGGLAGLRRTSFGEGDVVTNPVAYAVDAPPSVDETEPDDTVAAAQAVTLPLVVNGRVDRPGDLDWFRLYGNAGDEIVAEVEARRLGSPLDALVRLVDERGKVVAWNDDREDRAMGLLTHHADSYVRAKLPANGPYFVRLSDVAGHGGDEYGYRLRIGRPSPDFRLLVSPASVNLRAGASTVVTVNVVRRDGFGGDVGLELRGAPAGVRLDGATVPGGRERVRVTLTAPSKASDAVFSMSLVGRASVAGKSLERMAVPAEDEMQAFAYRHLAPADAWMGSVKGGGKPTPPTELGAAAAVRIPLGGRGRAHLEAPGRVLPVDVHLELRDPPKGLSIEDVVIAGDSVDFVIRSDAKAGATGAGAGYADNLIVDVYLGRAAPKAKAKAARFVDEAAARVLVGTLPAIPIEVLGG